MKRLSKKDYYLNIARAVSLRSSCLRRQYGVVIVKNDEIIATGYNGSPRGTDNCCDLGVCYRVNAVHNTGDYSMCPAVHAEQNAIISAKRSDLLGATLYLFGREGDNIVDAVPCYMCDRLIKNSGIKEVISSAKDMLLITE